MRTLSITVLAALTAAVSNAQTPYRVKDLNPGTPNSGAYPRGVIGDSVILMASGPGVGYELWVSDGTEAGTTLVRDLYPGGSAGVDDESVMFLGELFFQARHQLTDWELWRSDGTDAGTVQVADIVPGGSGSSPRDLTVMGSEVFFTASTSTYGNEVWKSDGTTNGTMLVADVNPNGNSWPEELTAAHGRLYFLANYAGASDALFRTDGTPLGTEQVLDLAGSPKPTELEEMGGELYFIRLYTSPQQTQELWKVSGPNEAAVKVAGLGLWSFFGADELTDAGDKLFFTDTPDLWVSDGTTAGTQLISTASRGHFTAWNGALFFRGYDVTFGVEPWTSDGTTAGTMLLKDVNAGPGHSNATAFGVFEDRLYFHGDDGVHGIEPWSSDGTPAGTSLLADLSPSGHSQAGGFHGPSGRMFFGAKDELAGGELWAMDTTNGATAYCTAGFSASGCRASIAAVGTPSASAPSGFTLQSLFVEADKDGLYFFGTNGRQANPWGNGTSYKCVVPPVKRSTLLTGTGASGTCEGAFTQDLNALWCPSCPKPLHNPGAGATLQAQLWYRDPGNTSNRTTSLSGGVEVPVGP